MGFEENLCPTCHGNLLIKAGKTGAGKQRFKCLRPDCRRRFVADSNHTVDPKIKALVINLLAVKVHPAKIAAAVPGMSLRWIYELRRRRKTE